MHLPHKGATMPDETNRFITLDELAKNIAEVARQASGDTMILSNGYGRLIAAIVPGSSVEEIHETAQELLQLGESHGFGIAPYFVAQSDLRASLRHCQCKLRNMCAVVIGLDQIENGISLLALLPLTPGIEGLLIGEAIQSGHIQLPNGSGGYLTSHEVAQRLGLPTPTA